MGGQTAHRGPCTLPRRCPVEDVALRRARLLGFFMAVGVHSRLRCTAAPARARSVITAGSGVTSLVTHCVPAAREPGIGQRHANSVPFTDGESSGTCGALHLQRECDCVWQSVTPNLNCELTVLRGTNADCLPCVESTEVSLPSFQILWGGKSRENGKERKVGASLGLGSDFRTWFLP